MKSRQWIICLIILFNFLSISRLSAQSETGAGDGDASGSDQTLLEKLKSGVNSGQQLVENTSELITKIDAAYDKITDQTQNRTLDFILNGKEVEFPVAILPGDGRQENQIILNQINFLNTGAFAEVFFRLKVSEDTDHLKRYLYFAAQRVLFTKEGGFTGELELVLLNPRQINLGENDKVKISVKKGTYVSFSCDGFEEVFLKAQLVIDKSVATPEDANKNRIDADLTVDLEVSFSDWENWLFTVSLDHFQFTQLPGYSATATNVTFDHSELNNATTFAFPVNHTTSTSGALWKGFFAEHISLTMPKEFRSGQAGNEGVTLSADNFIIDENGVSGIISASPILSLEKGRIGDWNFSIDEIAIVLENNSLVSGSLEGEIVFPTSEAGSNKGQAGRLGYTATISKSISEEYKLDYLFSVENRENLDFAIWKAEMSIYEGSRVDIERVDGKFRAEACLNGSLAVGTNLGKQNQTEPSNPRATTNAFSIGVEFTQLKIRSSGKPIISLEGDIRISQEGGNLANFPLQITYAGIINPSAGGEASLEGELEGADLIDEGAADGDAEVDRSKMIGLELGLSLSFMEGENGFGANAGLIFWAEQKPDTRKWKLERVQVTEVGVDVNNESFSIKGRLKFFDDHEIYGKGFGGCIAARFQPGIEVDVNARFGRKQGESEEYKYWYVDAGVTIPTPIPIFPAVGINGFVGGAYYHLKPQPLNPPVVDGCGNSQLVDYIPEKSTGLGIKAGLGLVSMPTESLFSGNVLFEINFSESGGIKYVAFSGLVEVMKKPEELGALASMADKATSENVAPEEGTNGQNPSGEPDLGSMDAAVVVDWLTYYDVENKVFSGTFNTYLDMVAVKGTKTNNRAGTVSIYISEDKWYFYMGQPLDMMEVSFVGLVDIGAYMVVGSELPTPPIAPMPPEIKFSAMENFNYDLLNEGGGMAFGARAKAEVDLKASLSALGCEGGAFIKAGLDVGFDVLLSKAYEPVFCDGKQRGVKNWYATGQVYILGYASVGSYVSCFGAGYDFTLVEMTAYAAMFAQLPNPSYMKGKFSASGEFIGINFNAEFEVEINEPCNRDTPSATELRLIEAMNPADSSQQVDVFTTPSVRLVYPNFKELSIPDINAGYDENNKAPKVNFRVHLNEQDRNQVVLMKLDVLPGAKPNESTTGTNVVGAYTWDEKGNVLTFTPENELEPATWYRWYVQVRTEQGTGWTQNGPLSQTQIHHFKTGELNTEIPDNNIAYSYPLPQMKNFYPAESNKGYIKTLVVPQSLLILPEGYTWEVQYLEGTKPFFVSRDIVVNKNPSRNQFEFAIPTNLKLNTTYKLRIVQTLLASPSANPSYQEGIVYQGDNPFLEGKDDIEILSYPFTTSSYKTFNEKFAQNIHQSIEVNNSQGVITMKLSELEFAHLEGEGETLSRDELYGKNSNGVQYKALVSGTIKEPSPGFMELVTPLIYTPLNNYNDGRDLSYDFSQALFIHNGSGGLSISYELPKHILYSLERLEKYYYFLNATNQGTQNVPSDEDIPDMEAGHYTYELHYYLPGQKQPNSTAVLGFDLNETIEL